MLEGIGANELLGVVIDAVGTLIEPVPPVSLAYRDAAIRQGIDLEAEEVRSRFGRAFREAEAGDLRGRLATDESGEVRRWRAIVARALPELPDPERGFLELWDHFGRPDSWRSSTTRCRLSKPWVARDSAFGSGQTSTAA
ncbi:MAG: hypothetical protein U0800_27245 [Isosphaeraceae bacterium]